MKTTTLTPQQQGGAGFGATASLVGFRLFEALGWRVGAGALLFAGCPLTVAGMHLLSFADRCVDSPSQVRGPDGVSIIGRAGIYELCTNYATEHLVGWIALGLAVVFILAAVGLWKRGGRVRDVEILAEQVEGATAAD